VANFCNSLEGNVLLVGDNGGAIAHRTQFRHTYTMYRGDPDFNLLKACPNPKSLIFNSNYLDLFNANHFDHIVVFLWSYPWRFPPNSRVHYLDLIPGLGGISLTEISGEFNLSGKLVSLHPDPRGSLVCHTSLFPVYDPMDHFVAWRSDVFPVIASPSLTPLTNLARLGPQNEVMISDKMDGMPALLEIKTKVARLLSPEGEIIYEEKNFECPNQLLVLENVGEDYYVVEPLYHELCGTFGSWLELGQIPEFDWLHFKEWFSFPKDEDWQKYAISGEGVVLKSKVCVLGAKDYSYRKLSTYFLKLPMRASYEDWIGMISLSSEKAYKGYHNIYTDPNKVYDGEGVYEVLLNSLSIHRKRLKKYADKVWYVEAVSQKINFDLVFTLPLRITKYHALKDQGLSAMKQVSSVKVIDTHVISESKGQIVVNFPSEMGSIMMYNSKYYMTVLAYEGHSVGNFIF